MLSVIPPSGFKETEIRKLIRAIGKRKGSGNKSLESTSGRSLVWMPYYRVQFEYRRSEKDMIEQFGETANSETAINAMFCGCAQGEKELLTLFRPNYLMHRTIQYSPPSHEIIAPTFHVDLDAILSVFLSRLNEARNELHELRSVLNKRYVRIRRYSAVLPMMGSLKESERLSEKIAKLNALTSFFATCLNLGEDAGSIKVIRNSTFYYPTAVVAFEHKERQAGRFGVLDLVKSGPIRKHLSCDYGLTQLCNNNDACNSVLARSVAHALLPT